MNFVDFDLTVVLRRLGTSQLRVIEDYSHFLVPILLRRSNYHYPQVGFDAVIALILAIIAIAEAGIATTIIDH